MASKPPLLVSRCLLGHPCRYDGKAQAVPAVMALEKRYELNAFCPEEEGGLSTPRPRAERQGDRVVTEAGQDVTAAFDAGARRCLALCQERGITTAILKSKSPSCGKGWVYDGSFSGRLVAGHGVTAQMLSLNGIRVLTENELDEL